MCEESPNIIDSAARCLFRFIERQGKYMKKITSATCKDYLCMTVGALMAGTAINTFFASHNLVFGGVAGLAIVIEYLTGLKISTINLLINVPLFLLGVKFIGKQFLIRSIYTTAMLSVSLRFTESLRMLQTDLIVSAVFGGILLGTGVAIVIKGGGSTGGSDMLALILHKNFGPPVSVFIFIIDTCIILFGVILFGVNRALYAIIVVSFISRTVNEASKHLDQLLDFKLSYFHT